ncbi:hypothetical protein POPTR_001G077040v4 [Populus trichocarpa]|uniref:BZIP domain-containing protein n=3 Tax=Populus trichocarpa TaxID=3694 RepID=A0A2K1R4X9_POPTR|nr:hypothetical protein POPTR_001G077040v4 [Populus trichocarpa]
MFYEFEGCRAISLDFARHDQTNFSSVSLNKPTPSRQIFEKLASCLLLQRKPAMDYESPWQNLFEASLALPAHEFEVYEEFETDQKARVNQQACNYFLAAGPASPHQSSNITDTDKKGQGLEATKDQVAKKRKIDKAYRERCKRNKIETERNLDLLRKENDRLKGENASFKTEAVRTRQTLQYQEQEMKRLRKTIVLLKEKHDKQNTVVEVLSKRLAGANDTDLQRENTQLKNKIALLRSQVNDQNNLDKLQLQEKNAQLEHDKSSLEVIVQALCEKINNEKGHEGDHAS